MAGETRTVQVPLDGDRFDVFHAVPEGAPNRPAVVVIQEWWGLNDHIRDIAGRLAAAGFFAVAPDLYDGRVTRDAAVAAELMRGLDRRRALGKLSAALDHAIAEGHVGSGRAGAIGFCMGGSFALQFAIDDARIGAAAAFYGQVPGDDALAGLVCPVLFIHAGKDGWITRAEADRLEAHLQRTGTPGEVVRYPDADHAFFNDTRPEVYRPEDAADAWRRTTAFFTTHLG